MAKQIAKLLKANIQDSSDLKQIAKQLAGKGRGGDSMLVHITPREATMLKEAGGAGTINPDTGLMEFFSLMDYAGDADISTGGYRTRAPAPAPSVDIDVPVSTSSRTQTYGDYRGSAFPYSPTKANEFIASTNLPPGEDMSEFPYGMSARYSLPPRGSFNQPGAATSAVTTGGFRPVSRAAALDVPDPYGKGGPIEFAETQMTDPSLVERAQKTVTSPRVLETLGLMGVSAIPGILQANRAREQGQRAREEMQSMAAPYRRRGQELLSSAQAGELSPQEQQQLQAMQARMAQGVAGRGGVGADQAANQIEAFRQQLLANKYDLGLKVSGIADEIATGAIRAGLEADQYVNELTTNYFSNAMQMAMMNMGQRPQTP
jgi:methylmalonyl-CoA mutase cobalamin-binding subunit